MTEKMSRALVGGGELEYETQGEGQPVVLVHGALIAGAFLPLLGEAALARRHSLIRYHRRGYAGSDAVEGSFSIEQQAADCRALLQGLGVERAHIVGHSYGGLIALQLALDSPALVQSLVLLEPALMMVPSAPALLEAMGPVVERYTSGDTAGAVEGFLKLVGGVEWETIVARTVPGGTEQAKRDAHTWFEVELPTLEQWDFDAGKAERISQPVLCVSGTESGPFFEEGRQLVHSWLPQTEDVSVAGANHLLPMQDPRSVAEGIANFLN